MSSPRLERALLHVYEPAKPSGPSIPGFGVYHTGIELGDNGVEWCYAGGPDAPGSGVQQQRAKQSPDAGQWRYSETIDLGVGSKTAAQCAQMLRDMQGEYPAREYDLIHHNCNHFTADVAKRLGLKYPAHINRAASFGAFFMDNPIKDRQRKEAERKAEEDRRRNVFANTTGHSLISAGGRDNKSAAPAAAAARPAATTTAAASPLHSAASTSAASPATNQSSAGSGTGGNRRHNPWADPSFFPGKGKPAAASAPGKR